MAASRSDLSRMTLREASPARVVRGLQEDGEAAVFEPDGAENLADRLATGPLAQGFLDELGEGVDAGGAEVDEGNPFRWEIGRPLR